MMQRGLPPLSPDEIALPVEAARPITAVLDDVRFKAFLSFIAPSPHQAYRRRVYVVPAHERRPEGGGWPWICLRRYQFDLERLIAAHILAGASGEPQRYASGRGAVLRAIGLSTPPNERLQYLSLDLDGQHDCNPAAVVRALRIRFGREPVLVTSSSGREGRYRALVRLATPIRCDEAATRAKSMLQEIGFPARSGAVEVFPSAGNSRLPFGLGGCRLFEDAPLIDGHDVHPLVLAERLQSLPPISLPPVSRVVRAASPRSRPSPMTPAAQKTRPPPAAASLPDEDTASRLWTHGVGGYGERDEAVWRLARDCHAKGLPQRDAVTKIHAWIDNGGLDRSREGQSQAVRDAQKRDIVRRVADAYRGARAQPHAQAHLTRREIFDTAVRAELAAKTPTQAAEIFEFMLSVLPTFKAATEKHGLALSHAWWRERGGERYAELREASQVFERVEPHKAAKDFGRDAHAAVWRTNVSFDAEVPGRRLLPARKPPQTPEYLFRRAKSFVTGSFPRDLRARVERWATKHSALGDAHAAIADSAEETIWRLVRESARRGASPQTLRQTVLAAIEE